MWGDSPRSRRDPLQHCRADVGASGVHPSSKVWQIENRCCGHVDFDARSYLRKPSRSIVSTVEYSLGNTCLNLLATRTIFIL